MFKAVLVLSAVLFSNGVSFAGMDTCQPTKTVAQAIADLEAKQRNLDLTLKGKYQAYMELRAKDLAAALASYEEFAKIIEVGYAEMFKKVSDTSDPAWRNKVDQLVEEYNEITKNNLLSYNGTLEMIEEGYKISVKQAQDQFNAESKAAADEYNRAICAQ